MTSPPIVPPQSIYPVIQPATNDGARPFWSVMIPVFNCAHYLRVTLASVLSQFAADDNVQIEVIDDCSTRDDPEAVVNECGDPRVRFWRQPHNVGPQATFTTCIQRSHGCWVHILHGDDYVAPGFYQTLKAAADEHSVIGAAFCRTVNVDADGQSIDLSPLEMSQAGIHANLITRLGVQNHIMFPSIAVKRSTYERVGGFHPSLFHAADWDMWKRVALAGPVWYEPTPLAMYRVHAASDTSALMRTGANIADARHAIEIAWRYLPSDQRDELTYRARLHHGLYALELAEEMVDRRAWPAVRAQAREAFRCSTGLPILRGIIRLARRSAWALIRPPHELTARS
jgi:glycosyltransferase involved in cell wall biosynthesis